MSLDKRSLEIVNMLAGYPRLKSKDLEKELGLSRRQIDYSFKKINEWLESLGLLAIRRNKNGNFIIDRQVMTHLSGHIAAPREKSGYYIPTEQERATLLILYIIAKQEELSLAHLYDVLEVSKNTVLSDIRIADKQMQKYQVSISYSRTAGYDIEGEEMQIRKLIIELVSSVLEMYQGEDYMKIFADIDQNDAVQSMKSIEQKLQIHYTDQSFEDLVYILLLNKRRIEQKRLLPFSLSTEYSDLKETKEYSAAAYIIEDLNDYPDQEAVWMTLQFLTANVREAAFDPVDDEELVDAIREMLRLFEKKTYTFIEDPELLASRLFLHLRPAYFRVRYQLTLDAFMYGQVVGQYENYSLLYELISEIIYPVETLVGEPFPENELILISFFFGAELMQQGVTLENKLKAIVVCSNGITISKIMKLSLKKLFPNFRFLSSLSIRQYKEFEKEFDIVFSTVPLVSPKPVFLVKPLMNEMEKYSLKKQVFHELGLNKEEELSIKKMMQVINRYSIIVDEKMLVESLRELINPSMEIEMGKESDSKLPGLWEYFSADSIQFFEEISDWKEAIRQACIPLMKEKKITEDYVEALINENDRALTYNFLGENMAIPHASAESGVLSDGFAMLILKKPVSFKNKQNIRIVIPLAIQNQTLHLKAITQLADMAEDKEVMKQILLATTSSEVLGMIGNYR